MKRFAPHFAIPALLVLAVLVAPLVSGRQTLILRDVLQTHFVDRIALGEGLSHFDLPLVDPRRAGGQALAGNLNALPFYPDNLLQFVSPVGGGTRATLWTLNAHFWLHWFLALGAMFWMARAFGLPAAPSWVAATVYAFSGYFVSQLNLYNTVAAAALAPALVAAFLESAPGKSLGTRRRGLLGAGLVWALLVLGGEPLLAAIALCAAALALVAVAGWRAFSARLALALGAGTLLAAPQIVEMARILQLSFRNNVAFGGSKALLGSFRPAHLADILWPFFFGRPNLAEVFAPHQFDGYPPIHFTLYPGLLALALALAGGIAGFSGGRAASGAGTTASGAGSDAVESRRRAAIWGAGALGGGLFFALGHFNPVVEGLWHLPWGRLLRFPTKFWLVGAIGGSLLCALGFEAAFTRGRRAFGRLLALLAALFAILLAASIAAPARVAAWVAALLQPEVSPAILAGLLVRLQGLTLLSIAMLLVALALVRLGRRSPLVGGLGLVCLHAATQGWAMLPALPMDEPAPYLEAPTLLAAIPPGSVVVHGGNHELFRPGTLFQGAYPDDRLLWFTRRAARELYPFTAVQHGLRAELAISPEGLDSFLTQSITVGLRNFSDPRRLDMLEALGVDYLLLDRELAPEALPQVREVTREPSFGQIIHLYEVVDRAREVELATRVVAAPHLNAALEAIFDPAFDPHRTAVVPGNQPVSESPGGAGDATPRLVVNERESVVVDYESAAPGVLFLRRAYLSIWRASIDDRPAPTLVTQVARLGVAVPAGSHRVRFWIDRRPLHAGFALALGGLALLAAVVLRRARVVASDEPKSVP